MSLRDLFDAAEQKDIAEWNHTCSIMALIANANRGKKGKAITALDFHPYGAKLKKAQKEEERARLSAMTPKEIEEDRIFTAIQNKAIKLQGFEDKTQDKWFKLGEYKSGQVQKD